MMRIVSTRVALNRAPRRGGIIAAMIGMVFIVIITVSLASAGADDSASDFIARIEGVQPASGRELGAFTLAQVMERYHVPGVSIAVIKDFKIQWAKGYGVADVVSGAPVNTETLFQAASISKPVAAMAVLKAVQEGRFGLDEDINQILKSWKLPTGDFTRDQPVTPRTLLSHTSGLSDGFGFPGYPPSAPRPTVVQILDGQPPSIGGPVRLGWPPLTRYKHSGGGVVIMQLAMIDTLGKPFPEIMRKSVLDPVGMTQSGYDQPLPPDRDRNAARAHDQNGQAMDAKWHVYPELEAAGLWTTPTDLAKFAIEVQQSLRGKSNRVLSRELTEEMCDPVGVGDYAVGFLIENHGSGWYFGHSGSNWGFKGNLIAHKAKGYGLAIMTNSDNGLPVINEIKARVAAAYDWDWDQPNIKH